MTVPPPARVALVTGAGRGLGAELARGQAATGVAVGPLGRSRSRLDAVAAEVVHAGGRAAVTPADVRSWDEVTAAVRAVEDQLGPVDLLVNNAGVIDPVEVPVWEADPTDWWEVVETDLRGPFHCIRAVVPGMVQRGGGRVVDLNSGAGAADRDVYSAYCAAKAGLFRISGSIRIAGAERGLRSFEISPGTVRTDMTASMAIHVGRTEWTPSAALVDLVVGVARGELDAWSGRFLRAGVDTVASLQARAAAGDLGEARFLRVRPHGPDDPLT